MAQQPAGSSQVALGVRLEKPSRKDWPAAYWAVVGGEPRRVVAHATSIPPRSYDEGMALRHLHEGTAATVREHAVTRTLVWAIEPKAKLNQSMRPRLRAEGVVAAGAAAAGSDVGLVAWSEIQSRAGTDQTKAACASAGKVCGVSVGGADAHAVLAAVAALRT